VNDEEPLKLDPELTAGWGEEGRWACWRPWPLRGEVGGLWATNCFWKSCLG